MRKLHYIFILIFSLCFFSCANDSSDNTISTGEINNTNNGAKDKIIATNEINNTDNTTNIYVVDIGKSYIITGDIKNRTWYAESDKKTTYLFTDSRIIYNSVQTNPLSIDYGIGAHKGGNLKFLNTNISEFEFIWDDGIGGSQQQKKILICDNDILVFNDRIDHSGTPYILYKDLEAYNNNMPSKRLYKTNYNSYSQFYVFTPTGKCYKRYLNLSNNEYLIVCGNWEKTGNNTFKLFWSSNKNTYDILKNTSLYQGISENPAAVPITLYLDNN